jgi:hypothetical protein
LSKPGQRFGDVLQHDWPLLCRIRNRHSAGNGCLEVLLVSPMEQLSLFDLPDEPVRFIASNSTLSEKWDGWWLQLLREPRPDWEDREDFDLPVNSPSQPKQQAIPGLG